MAKKLALFFSYVFHPIWMPLITFGLAYLVDPWLIPNKPVFNFIGLILIINAIAPLVSIFIMMRRGMISDVEIKNRNERTRPYLIILFYFILTYWLLRNRQVPVDPAVFSMFLGVILSVICAMIINRFWKISAHMLAIGGLVGVMLGLAREIPTGMPFIIGGLFFIAGGIGFSRIYLEAHTHNQVYAGFTLGLMLNFALVNYELVV
jgi:hypothetical protein